MRSIPGFLVFAALLAVLGAARAAAEPVMLAEYPHAFSWTASPASGNEARFLVKAPNGLGFLCAVGGSLVHGDGQTGTYDFFPDDPLEPGFPCVVGNVTDGLEDSVGNWLYAVEIEGEPEGTGIGIAESALFGTPSDLLGSEISHLRLIVDSLAIQPSGGGGHEFVGQVRWQFWGTSPPTPAPDRIETSSWGHVRSLYR